DSDEMQADPDLQPRGMDIQLEPPRVVGLGDKRNHGLGTARTRIRCPAVDAPPGARILVDPDLLAGFDLKDDAVGTPEDGMDRSDCGPRPAAIIRGFPRSTERGGVATVSQHRFVSLDDSVAPQNAGVAKAFPDIDDLWDRRSREPTRLRTD